MNRFKYKAWKQRLREQWGKTEPVSAIMVINQSLFIEGKKKQKNEKQKSLNDAVLSLSASASSSWYKAVQVILKGERHP